MTYPDHFEQKLGFDHLREMLTGYTLCPLGAERVHAMRCTGNPALVRQALEQVTEMKRLLTETEFPANGFVDARAPLQKLRLEGAFVEPKELLAIRRALQGVRDVRGCFSAKQEGTDRCKYPQLDKLTEGIIDKPDVIRAIDKVIDTSGEVRDNASPTLLHIRRELQGERGRMGQLMQRVLQRAKQEGLVEEDTTPALRNGRLVIPIAADRKRKLNGIVHDISDTGRTAYVEPAEVVETTARLCELENEERREIIAILRATASLIRPHTRDALRGCDFLADADFVHAKALLARYTHGEMPASVDDEPLIDWAEATHPILRISLEGQGKQAVPLTIRLVQPDQRILLISGPNAGGKSVCLKTVGLLQYMLQCGLLPPLAPSSRCGIFRQFFLHIGDEQDLSDDLSTYSAHLLSMKRMLQAGDDHSLLLIDEFGSGTDPQMGAALAQAMLQRFLAQGCFAIITTHYHNLKVYAADNAGIRNAAMLYDRQAMAPLFLLQIGTPGSSFAIEIAHKIGLPHDVIQEAKRIAGSELVKFDKFLQDINRDKRYWESKRAEAHQREKNLERVQQQYEQQLSSLRAERKQLIDNAKAHAQRLIDESKARIERTIREIKEAQAERERTKDARAALDQWMASRLGDEEQEARTVAESEPVNRCRQRKENKPKQARSAGKHTPESAPLGTPQWKEGAYVMLPPHTAPGIIIKVHGKEALIAFGDIQINASLSQLKPCAPPLQKRTYTATTRQTQEQIRDIRLQFSPEINVMGMRADEALQAVALFLDDALVCGASRLRIVHGTGTGALKTTIRQFLATHHSQLQFHDDTPQLGGAGVTIVEIRE